MLRTQTDLWRLALLTSLGIFPNACGAQAGNDTNGPGPITPGGSPEAGVATENTFTPQPNSPPGEATACTDVVRNGVNSGLKECDNGVVHRPVAQECASMLPRTEADAGQPQNGFANNDCRYDADCDEGAYGHCALQDAVPLGPVARCSYGCASDGDCSSDQACVCGDPVGTCVTATCRADSDCGEGMKCAQWAEVHGIGCGPGTPIFTCTTPEDECVTDADCGDSHFCSAATGVRKCTDVPNVACGRPFLVDGQERLAPLTTSAAWASDTGAPAPAVYQRPTASCTQLEPLTEVQRQTLGKRWAELGLMEHASIAAFARFTLQLLHLGAPASLVEETHMAMADETQHARDCFALAQRYLGYAVGPGALPMHQALQETTLEEIVRLTVREGCIGETCAALEAAEACEATVDPDVKTVLEKIRADELRHAELAWRFVSWALTEAASTGDAQARLRRMVRAEFASAAEEVAVASVIVEGSRAPADGGFDSLPHGVVPNALLPEIRRRAMLDIVLPCAEGLLSSLAGASDQETAPVARANA